MTSIKTLLQQATARLADHESAVLDAEVLLAHVLEKDRSHLRAWPEKELTAAQTEAFEALVARRAAGEPVAHLTGLREFWSLALTITPDTLIPRPETELLVEQALERLPPGHALRVADLGTGSGAIALAVASERPACHVVATDRSAAALAVARENTADLGLHNVVFAEGDWCAALGKARFHLVVSNPPYVRTGDPHLTQGDVRFEPMTALAAGTDGLDDVRAIITCAAKHLEPGGWLLLEHGWDQGDAVRALLQAAGYADAQTCQDTAGRDRVSMGRRE
jgi:release factor glutamine methyltransferase